MVSGDKFKFAQLNLHRSNNPSLLFDRFCMMEKIDFALFQEPHCYNGTVTSLKSGSIVIDKRFVSPRAGIMVRKGHCFMVLNQFCSRDMITISVGCESHGSSENVLICSAYLPGDDVLPNEFIALMEYCLIHNEHLIVGCDANAHHTIW